MTDPTTTETQTEEEIHEDVLERAEVDRSARLPVLYFFTSGALWLVLSVLFGFIASFKIHDPDFLHWGWFTYGKVNAAHINMLVYGWGFNAGMGVAVWLMARLCRTRVRNPLTILVGGLIWNSAVALGIVAILLGWQSHSLEWMEFPSFIWPVLLAAYTVIMVWLVVMFRARRAGHVYISQWYLLGAVFWFPWVYITANVFTHVIPSAAVMATALSSWYVSNITLLWFTPIALATAYYLLPKLTGRPVYSYPLAMIGFWALAALAGWTGIQRHMGGPFPAWMPAVGSGATILMLIPVAAVALNLLMTIRVNMRMIEYSPTFRFTMFGAIAYVVISLISFLFCFYPVTATVGYTTAIPGLSIVAVYAFFSMTMFGAIYFIVPRIVGCEWKSGKWIRFHFWFSAYGTIGLAVLYVIGGYSMGSAVNKYEMPFHTVLDAIEPYAIGRSVLWLLILMSNLTFVFHLTLMVFRLGIRSSEPTLLHAQHGSSGEDDSVATPGKAHA